MKHYIQFFLWVYRSKYKSIKNVFQFSLQIHEAVKHNYCFSTIQSTRIAVIMYLLAKGTTEREEKWETNIFFKDISKRWQEITVFSFSNSEPWLEWKWERWALELEVLLSMQDTFWQYPLALWVLTDMFWMR